MTREEFRESISHNQPPCGLSAALGGLWWDAKGNWDLAHKSAQQDESPAGAWVHAYLHRKEGDAPNAGYWYRRAHQPHCYDSLDEEWSQIAEALLAKHEMPS